MSASPFLSHVSFTNTFISFTNNPKKVPTHLPFCNQCKVSFITLSSRPTNGLNFTESETRIIKCEGQDLLTSSSESSTGSGSSLKARTAPWMNEPLIVKPTEIMEFAKPKTKKDSTFGRNEEHPDMTFTGKVGGGRGKVAMKKIFKGIDKLKETQILEEMRKTPDNLKFRFSPGDLWGKGDIQNGASVVESSEPQEYLKSSEFDIPLTHVKKKEKLKKMPWERDERMVIMRVKKERKVMAAEMRLDGMLLERLRGEAAMMKKWVKVKKAGVTQAVIDQVRLIWRNNELALLKFDVPLCRNMDRAREIVEVKTGGTVVWSNKDFLAVYRGCNYQSCSKDFRKICHDSSGDPENSPSTMTEKCTTTRSIGECSLLTHGTDDKLESLHMPSLYEREADRSLDGLGPRFVDWWMPKPLPVDADLLPEIVPGLKTPFRLCLPSTRSKLTDAELTHLRKLAHPLPTHFVLGRNRKLQGLAAAILKLWEKCHIAKIAVKWGIPNTDNEQMANELKSLTGGVLLLRNKYFIILYRGKDFVPPEVAYLVSERETELTRFQLEEEAARIKASEIFSTTYEHSPDSGIIGTLSEFDDIQSEVKNLTKGKTEFEIQLEAEQEKLEKELRDQERKLFILKKKIERSAKLLEKLNNMSSLSEQDADQEIISQEEKRCLRKMGLKMNSSLVLGRRGIYDGVIEGMHQRWKHREIVKVITMQKKFSQVIYTAKCLETESGGLLVSIDKLKEGHAIIIYRGKNYKRPDSAARNLLNKREALSKSLEIQRLGSLKFFARQRERTIFELKRKLAEFSERKS